MGISQNLETGFQMDFPLILIRLTILCLYFLLNMKQMTKILVVLLLTALASTQVVDLTQVFTPETIATLGPEYNDPNFMKVINNYFGCKEWKDGFCVACSQGFIFNKNGICCKVDPNCQLFNRDVGVCEQCYNGFNVDANGTCKAWLNTDPAYNGCAEWKNNVCQACSAKHYFDANKVCVAVSDQCREWDVNNGQCTSCYFGYIVDNGACVVDPNAPGASDVAGNPNCKVWNNEVCEECAFRHWFDANGICQAVANQCNTWDNADGLCLSCYQGYDLVNGACEFSPSNTQGPADLGCKAWDQGVCIECSPRWVMNNNGACVPVSDICRTHDINGLCLTCYQGYDLVNGNCEFSPANTAAPSDPGCKTWNNGVCEACSQNWVFDANNVCVPVSDACRTHDASGACTGCWKGYDLSNNECVFSPTNTQGPTMFGCKVWNWDAQTCSECSAFWFFNADGVCTEVSALCASSDANGACTGCYSGFALNNGVCEVTPPQPVSDAGCKTWNNGVCEACSDSWVFDQNGVCRTVSDQCKTHDLSNGWCTSCYQGYDLTDVLDANNNVVDRTCNFSPSNTAAPADLGCKAWNNGACSECSANWFFDANNVCQPVSDLCKSFDVANGQCLSCYQGYDLVNGVCEFSPSNTAAPSDPGCKTW